MTCGPGERPFLAPTGHASEDEPWIAGETHIRTRSQTLHHPGPKSLDDDICDFDQFQQQLDTVWVLQIEADAAPTSREKVERRRTTALTAFDAIDAVDEIESQSPGALDAIDPQNLGPHVGKHHRRKGRRSEGRNLDNLHTAEGSH